MALIDIPPEFVTPQPADVRVVKKLSQRHHELARMLAGGVSPHDAAVILHYDPSRVSVLQTDAAFQALLQFYARQRDELFIDTHKKLAVLGNTAIEEIQCRLEESPSDISMNQLLEVVKTATDRSGHGPTSTQRNVNVTLTASELAALKRNAVETQLGSVELLPQQQLEREVLGGATDVVLIEAQPTPTEEGNSTEGPTVPRACGESNTTGGGEESSQV